MALQMSQEEASLLRQQQQQLTKEVAEAKALAVMRAPSSSSHSHLLDSAYLHAPDMEAMRHELEAAREREGRLREELREREESAAAELEKVKEELTAVRAAASAATVAAVNAGAAAAAAVAAAGGTEAGESSTASPRHLLAGTTTITAGSITANTLTPADIAVLEVRLMEREREVVELRQMVDDARERESALETDLATMWVLVAELRRYGLRMAREKFKAERAAQVGRSTSTSSSDGGGSGRKGVETDAWFLSNKEVTELAGKFGQEGVIEDGRLSGGEGRGKGGAKGQGRGMRVRRVRRWRGFR